MHTQKIEKVTVQRLVQWSTCAPVIGRLEENNSYQRKTQVCFGSAEFASKYVLKILHGNDDEIITLNMKEKKAYIIDGAQRINTLVKFQQGLIPLVVPWGELPDNVACTGYGEPDDKYVKEQFHPDPEKMVQAYYSQMTPTVQNRFMQSTVNVVKIEDLSNEKERVMHCQLNELSEWGVSAVKTAEKEVQTSDDISLEFQRSAQQDA